MRSNIAFAAALAHIAAAAPAPQQFDLAAVLNAPSPTNTAPPTTAVATSSSTGVNSASLAQSISAAINTEASASVTGASASAASTEQPSSTLEKRGGWGGWGGWDETTTKVTSSAKSTTSSVTKPVTSSAPSTTSVQTTGTATTSSSTSCPTTPEDGTYCGFINPEDPCAVQPDGYGPKVSPDTVEAFKSYSEFHQQAQNAETPSGYEEVFQDLDASVSGNSYITFYTLESYDVAGCAAHCDNTDLCTAFNIYIERDPSLNPTKGDNESTYCPNPSSITNYKCSLWGSDIDQQSATNTGDNREDFQTVVVGSNGYDKTNNTTPPDQDGWDKPEKCDNGAISGGGNYWMGSHFYPGPYNPFNCAHYAQAQTEKNKEGARSKGAKSYTPVNMFNSYMVHKNGKAQGTYCQIFDTHLSPEWAGFKGTHSGRDRFDVKNSWTYSLKNLDDGKFH
ncbi:hypothetical protein KC318_g6367 [Hortaea werneckii]|uniref:Apple domain-containing protein n=1 Tax=Hortaea werneckii TaxID=91943 RepID=A0A3M7AVH7_HORWE|nr:hypothetical protein KC334_g13158 [Hortaea werneckii]KAI7666670.1 hypothetical protein KC318_g6367 [Hortaea werneckii]RMY17125.1 hypothetical protein D0867_06257 [Hortaea werneckii]RMY31377.1 hypothetical protein D0866_07332 [Hortaea werneckii]